MLAIVVFRVTEAQLMAGGYCNVAAPVVLRFFVAVTVYPLKTATVHPCQEPRNALVAAPAT
jgi:hypothetical protein